MKHQLRSKLKNKTPIYFAICTIILLIACGGGGSGGGDNNGGPESDTSDLLYSADGGYTYFPNSGTVYAFFSATTFPVCCGPDRAAMI